jgi:hypothetical protein
VIKQPLACGLREDLVTKGMLLALAADIELEAKFAGVDPADQPHVLARHIYELTRRAFEGRADPEGRIELLNDLVALLEVPAAEVDAPARQLRRLAMAPAPGVLDCKSVRPKTPLSDAALLTNSASEPNRGLLDRGVAEVGDEFRVTPRPLYPKRSGYLGGVVLAPRCYLRASGCRRACSKSRLPAPWWAPWSAC